MTWPREPRQTITLTVKLDLNFAGDSVSNTGTITSGTYDPNPLNNTSSVVVPVVAEADMSITKTANPASPATVHAGDEITYTLVATNNGPSYAQNVTVSDAAPLGTTLVSFTPGEPTCSELATTVACHLGTMAPGDSDARTISIVVRVDPSAAPGTTHELRGRRLHHARPRRGQQQRQRHDQHWRERGRDHLQAWPTPAPSSPVRRPGTP